MEIVGYFAALGAASCWAFSSVLSVNPVRHLGPIAFNTLRMTIVAVTLTLWLLITGQWHWPEPNVLQLLLISGFIGIFLGDTLLFTSVKILGPRLPGLLFATNAPLTFIVSLFLFDESYQWMNLIGVFAVSTGVFIAISARSAAGKHQWETSVGHSGFGLAAGFGAALCQTGGALLVVEVLRNGQDPVFATTIRVWVAVIFLFFSLFFTKFSGGFVRYKGMGGRMILQVGISGILGMGIGMSLYLLSLSLAPVGIATILSATTPIIVLPVLWLLTRERPALRSLLAALLVVIGTNMIFLAGH